MDTEKVSPAARRAKSSNHIGEDEAAVFCAYFQVALKTKHAKSTMTSTHTLSMQFDVMSSCGTISSPCFVLQQPASPSRKPCR